MRRITLLLTTEKFLEKETLLLLLLEAIHKLYSFYKTMQIKKWINSVEKKKHPYITDGWVLDL